MFELPVSALEIKAQVESFFEARVLPNNKLWIEQANSGQPIPAVELELREEARQLGLWNMALPRLEVLAVGWSRQNGFAV